MPVDASQIRPWVLALFHQRIEGDDALMRLARRRFLEAGLGTEIHAVSRPQLEWLLQFRPTPDTPVIIHLPRDINLCLAEHRQLIEDYAARFAGAIYGCVVHDQTEMATREREYACAVRQLESRLLHIRAAPFVFIENATGIRPEIFVRFHRSLDDLTRVSICLDVGHLGIWQARQSFNERFPGQNVGALTPFDPRLPELIGEVDRAVATALPAVLEVVRELGGSKRPVHFHLHDGHPLAKRRPFGLSDHFSFLDPMILGHPFKGGLTLKPMFGPAGLTSLVGAAVTMLGASRTSFTLEIHPDDGRLPLADAADLFHHWQDKTNAEMMNHWLDVLVQNQRLLQQAIRKAGVVP